MSSLGYAGLKCSFIFFDFYSERENPGIHAREDSESREAKEENTMAFRPCLVYFR